MAYTIQNFNDGIVLTAEHLNHIESGIVANAEEIANTKQSTSEHLNNIEAAVVANADEIANIKQNASPTSRIGKVELLLDAWVSYGTTMYKQVVSIDGVTKDSKVDLTPDTFQLKEFSIVNIALVAVNDGGSVTVYSVGGKPAGYYMIPVTITEVTTNDSKIVGASVGANVDVNQVLLGTGILSTVNKNTEDISNLLEEIANIKQNGSGGGLTTAQVNALDGMFKKCAYTGDVSTEYEAFKTAFGIGGTEEPDTPDVPVEPDVPEVTLTSISATYNGGNVVVGTSVNSLTGITVKATYSDGSTKNVTGYTLSGTIVEGNNTITVSYQGKTTTFPVVGYVEEEPDTPVEPSEPTEAVYTLAQHTFDGTTSIDTGFAPFADKENDAFTIMLDIDCDSAPNGGVMSWRSNGSNYMQIAGAGSFYWTFTIVSNNGAKFADNKYATKETVNKRVVMVHENNSKTFKAYHWDATNSVVSEKISTEVEEYFWTNFFYGNTNTITVGAAHNGSKYTGGLSDVYIYNRVCTSEEINTYIEGGNA